MPKVIPEYRTEAKRKIIAAGLEVMSQKGYNSTTLEDIAHHIGVSKTTIYLYFSNKEDLIIEIIRSVHQGVQHAARAYFMGEPILDAWVHLLELFLGHNLEHVGFNHDILVLSAHNPDIRRIHQEHMNAILEDATRAITHLQNKGEIRTDADPRTIALTFVALLSGLSDQVLKGLDREEILSRFREIGKIILEQTPPRICSGTELSEQQKLIY